MVTGTCYVVVRLREVALPTSGLILIGSSSLERATSSGILEIGPAEIPSNLFFAFMKAGERCHAAWNLSRLNCYPLRKICVIITHAVEPRFFSKLPMVFGEDAMHLGDLFIGSKAFCTHPFTPALSNPLAFLE